MEVDPPENENILNRVGSGVSSILSASFNAPSPVIKSLLQLRNTGACPNSNSIKEAEKEIKSLSKKVKPGLLQELKQAISSQNVLSKCVTVPRLLDGRQQDREKPHILLCRYWRYPMLQPHDQLKSMSHCMYGCQLHLEKICINPFHYELENVLPMVYVHNYVMGMPGSTSMLPENSGSFRNFRYHGGTSNRDDLCNGIGNILPNNVELPNYSDNPMMPPGNYVSPPISDDGMMIGLSAANCGVTDMQFLPSPEIPINSSAHHHVPYEEPESWCDVLYFEKSTQVGKKFHARKRVLTVDGGTDPSNNGERFCVGHLSNYTRESAVEYCRRYIGRGVKFTYCDGEVIAECLNDRYSIFVQSVMSNLHLGCEKSTVDKVKPGDKLTIFNNKEFADLLIQTVPKGYEAVYAMSNIICKIRLSFGKGWGGEYSRPEIKETPCWIEIQLNGPSRWLDRVLSKMSGPTESIHSFT